MPLITGIVYRDEKGAAGDPAFNLTPDEVDNNFRILEQSVEAIRPAQEFSELTALAWDFTTDGIKKTETLTANTVLTLSGRPANFDGALLLVTNTNFTLSIDGADLTANINPTGETMIGIVWIDNLNQYRFYTNYSSATGGTVTRLATPVLSLTVLSDTQIRCDWNDITGESEYLLQRKSGASAYSSIAGPTADIITYLDSGRSAGTLYDYRLKAISNDPDIGDSLWSEASATTTGAGGGGTAGLAETYINAVIAAGGSFTTAQQNAWHELETFILATGESKFKQALFYAGGSADTALIDFMGNANATAVQAPTVDAFGVVLNGSSQYINSNVIPANVFSSGLNIGYTRKLKTNAANNDRSGVYDSSNSAVLGINLTSPTGNIIYLAGHLTYTGVKSANGINFSEVTTVVRRSATVQETYTNTTIEDGVAITPGDSPDVLATLPMYYGAQNFDGSPFDYTANTLQCDILHEGLTADQVSSLQVLINSIMTGLGR